MGTEEYSHRRLRLKIRIPSKTVSKGQILLAVIALMPLIITFLTLLVNDNPSPSPVTVTPSPTHPPCVSVPSQCGDTQTDTPTLIPSIVPTDTPTSTPMPEVWEQSIGEGEILISVNQKGQLTLQTRDQRKTDLKGVVESKQFSDAAEYFRFEKVVIVRYKKRDYIYNISDTSVNIYEIGSNSEQSESDPLSISRSNRSLVIEIRLIPALYVPDGFLTAEVECPGSLPSQLKIGDRVGGTDLNPLVLPDPNRILTPPNSNGETSLGVFDKNSYGTVIAGPVCVIDILSWQIMVDRSSKRPSAYPGWVGEGRTNPESRWIKRF